jgi:hypothetical protein
MLFVHLSGDLQATNLKLDKNLEQKILIKKLVQFVNIKL